jgi:hypothetical protein
VTLGDLNPKETYTDSRQKPAAPYNKSVANAEVARFASHVQRKYPKAYAVVLDDPFEQPTSQLLALLKYRKNRLFVPNWHSKAVAKLNAHPLTPATWVDGSWSYFFSAFYPAMGSPRLGIVWFDAMCTVRKMLDDLDITFKHARFEPVAYFAITYAYRDSMAEELQLLSERQKQLADECGIKYSQYYAAQQIPIIAARYGYSAMQRALFSYANMQLVIWKIQPFAA